MQFKDLHDAARFYDDQQDGLGTDLLATLGAEIDSLVDYAGIHIQVHGYYKFLSKRFPYAIFYKVDGELVNVHRVLDLRRDPRRIKRSLK